MCIMPLSRILLLFLFKAVCMSIYAQKAVAELEKMNVIYVGLENPMRIAVEDYKSENLVLTPSQGKLEKNETGYNFLVTRMGDVQLFISDTNGKALDTLLFRARYLPKQYATFGVLTSGTHSATGVSCQRGIYALFPSSMVYEDGRQERSKITNFNYYIYGEKDYLGGVSNSGRLPKKLRNMLFHSSDLELIVFNNITIEGPDGTHLLNDIVIQVRENVGKEKSLVAKGKLSNGETIREFSSAEGHPTDEIFFQTGSWKYFNSHDTSQLLITREYNDSGLLLSEKTFYESGQLKSEFEIITAVYKHYYASGKIKMTGQMIGPGDSISFLQLHHTSNSGSLPDELIPEYVYSFPTITSYVPYGEWKFYDPTGAIKVKGAFKLYLFDEGFGSVTNKFPTSYSDVIYSDMNGPWHYYDDKGNIIYLQEFE